MTTLEGDPLEWGVKLGKCSVTICIAKFGYCHVMSSVCLSFVTRVYCDKMTKARIMQFLLKPNTLLVAGSCRVLSEATNEVFAKTHRNISTVSLISFSIRAETRLGWFVISFVELYLERCDIELRSQLITSVYVFFFYTCTTCSLYDVTIIIIIIIIIILMSS